VEQLVGGADRLRLVLNLVGWHKDCGTGKIEAQ